MSDLFRGRARNYALGLQQNVVINGLTTPRRIDVESPLYRYGRQQLVLGILVVWRRD